jgi:hypothetical protein
MSETAPLVRRRLTASPAITGTVALWGLLCLSLISVTIRPIVAALDLPRYVLNIDALLTPVVVAAVVITAIMAWRRLPRAHRLLTIAVGALSLSMAASWLVASPRSLVSLALGGAVLLLLPLSLYLLAMATTAPSDPVVRRVVLLMVLLQLCVGLAQYILLSVAQKAPFGADLVDGTTSHNFWPVFALPASMILVLTGRERSRFLWPVAVVLLAIYSEAKAALIIWLPIMAVVLGWQALKSASKARPWSRRTKEPDVLGRVVRIGIVAAAAAVVLIGLWWTPSVQGTWSVFIGHSRELEYLATTSDRGEATAPDIREGISVVSDSLTSEPVPFIFGRGPANTTSHAAEVLAAGNKNGLALPAPGPLAQQLLPVEDPIKFRDAQSSLLGVWGDLGTLGAALYLTVCAGAAFLVFRSLSDGSIWASPRAWSVPFVAGGLLAGGTLLDWPEQASIVLPVVLAILALAARPIWRRE